MNTCKSCWWQEGGRCYFGNPERDSDGRSQKEAKAICDFYKRKRAILGQLIPSDKLTIISEENEIKEV